MGAGGPWHSGLALSAQYCPKCAWWLHAGIQGFVIQDEFASLCLPPHTFACATLYAFNMMEMVSIHAAFIRAKQLVSLTEGLRAGCAGQQARSKPVPGDWRRSRTAPG